MGLSRAAAAAAAAVAALGVVGWEVGGEVGPG